MYMYRQRSELTELLEPVVSALGYEMLGVQYLRRKRGALVRVYIDNETGVTLHDCVRVNEQVIGVLDVHDPIKEHYHLEISSPGLDRPLFTLAQFERFLGRTVRLKLRQKVAGRRNIAGVIKAVQEAAVLVGDDGADYLIVSDQIESAHLVPSQDD